MLIYFCVVVYFLCGLHKHTALFLMHIFGLSIHNVISGCISRFIGIQIGSQGGRGGGSDIAGGVEDDGVGGGEDAGSFVILKVVGDVLFKETF